MFEVGVQGVSLQTKLYVLQTLHQSHSRLLVVPGASGKITYDEEIFKKEINCKMKYYSTLISEDGGIHVLYFCATQIKLNEI